MSSVEKDVAVVTPGSKGCRTQHAKRAWGKPCYEPSIKGFQVERVDRLIHVYHMYM